jgi:hypothetical protein
MTVISSGVGFVNSSYGMSPIRSGFIRLNTRDLFGSLATTFFFSTSFLRSVTKFMPPSAEAFWPWQR